MRLVSNIRLILALCGVILLVVTCQQETPLSVAAITTELMEKPVGISGSSPRFGWRLLSKINGVQQTAYQVIVKKNESEFWNSGRIDSNKSQFVKYEGKLLTPGTRYAVSLKVWDNQGNEATAVSYFEMAPNELSAKWIGAITREEASLPKGRNWHSPSLKTYRDFYDSIPELAMRSIQLRKEVDVTKAIKKATVYISGLGHYELSLNGQKIGKSQFAPLWTDYDKSIFYNTLGVTDQLQNGKNAFGVLLGNGMYNVIGDRYRKFWVSFGPPTLFFQLVLDYEDGTTQQVCSDESWMYSKSPITFNDIFGGEDYDAQLEQDGWDSPGFDESDWHSVVIQHPPKGKLKAQLAPAVEVQDQYEEAEWFHLDSSSYVFDMKQNLSGFPSIKVKGKAGQKVKLVVGERLDSDSSVNQRNTGRPHFYVYTLKGDGVEEWQPKFSYYGYQYIQVEGVSYKNDNEENDLPRLMDITSNFIYTNAKEVGVFQCSNELFTQTHTLINNAIKSNMQAVLTDCPHREKLGWLEQIHLVGPGLIYNYDMTQSLAKQMMDMEDAQRASGMVPNIAPEYVDFSKESWGADFTDSPEWGIACIIVPWQYFEYYGDDSLIRNYFDVMTRYVDYLTSKSKNHIVSHGLGDWYDYGEHNAGYGKNSPVALSATSHYYWASTKVADAAIHIGNEKAFNKYHELADKIKEAFNQEFFDPKTKQYGTGSQFSNAVALYMDLAEPADRGAVLENLIGDIKAQGTRLTTGDVGNRYLFQTLADNGLNELMYQMNNHQDVPGYGYQLQFGLTTLTEQWDPQKGNSWNHFMLGQIEEWFYKSLLGIVPDITRPGFKHFYIAPKLVGDMTYAKGSTESIYGEIGVSWTRKGKEFEIEVNVPVNSTATLMVLDGVLSDTDQIPLNSGLNKFSFQLNP